MNEHTEMGDPTYTIFAEFVSPFVEDGVGYVFPDDYQKKPLGSGEDVRDIITSYYPDIKWSGPSYGGDSFEGQVRFYYEKHNDESDYGWSEFRFRDRPCDVINVKCYYQHFDQLLKLCDEQGWALFSDEWDRFINDPDDNWPMSEVRNDFFNMLTFGQYTKMKRKGFFRKLSDLFRFRRN